MFRLFFYKFCNQSQNFARIGVSPGLEFGVYQRIVYGDLESTPLGRDKRNTFYLRLEVF